MFLILLRVIEFFKCYWCKFILIIWLVSVKDISDYFIHAKSSLPKVFFQKVACPWSNQTATLHQEIWWLRGAIRSSLPNMLLKKLFQQIIRKIYCTATSMQKSYFSKVARKLDSNISSILMFSCRFSALLAFFWKTKSL